MCDLKKCTNCLYFERGRRYYDPFVERYSRGCSRFGSTSDCYDFFNRLVFRGDKSCFVPARQITMEILEENK